MPIAKIPVVIILSFVCLHVVIVQLSCFVMFGFHMMSMFVGVIPPTSSFERHYVLIDMDIHT